MIVMAGLIGSTLYVVQDRMRETFKQLFEEKFESDVKYFIGKQDAQLASIRERALSLSTSVRLIAVMEEGDSEAIYRVAWDELSQVLGQGGEGQQDEDMRGPARRMLAERTRLFATYFRILDEEGEEIEPPMQRRMQSRPPLRPNGRGRPDPMKRRLPEEYREVYQSLMSAEDVQHVGYLAPPGENSGVQLVEVVFTKVVDSFSGDVLGAIVLGFPLKNDDEIELEKRSRILSGMMVGDDFYSGTIDDAGAESLLLMLRPKIAENLSATGMGQVQLGGEQYNVMYRRLNPGSKFPPAYHVALYSLSKQLLAESDLRWKIITFGCIVLMGALVLSILLSHGFSGPIRELVAATEEIREGHFETRVKVRSRDEIGRLSESFNGMAADLETMENYRNVLNMVADKEVAEQLMSGNVSLGGEMRDISVLFCDIRGFTALTQDMPPTEVIDLMNDHMTALTRVVYEHDGVVDKFVGDLIMAVFGAPRSSGNDAHNATRCAVRMIEERDKLNEKGGHQITVGIGVASGPAVAGCMGSEDRLNYTVLGERVNLAARLCSVADRQEVVIDQTTYELLEGVVGVDPLPPLQVKGFSHEVNAFKVHEVRSISKPVIEENETA